MALDGGAGVFDIVSHMVGSILFNLKCSEWRSLIRDPGEIKFDLDQAFDCFFCDKL